MAITTAQIQQLYVAYLGRAADKAGLDYWSQQLNAEKPVLTLDSLRVNFVTEQKEYSDAYAGLSRGDQVVKIYNNLFGRAPDAAGLAYWSTGGGATVPADQLLTAFIAGASATDAKIVANKVLVSEVYTSTAGANYAAADAKSILSGVDDTSASVTVAVGHLSDGSLSGIAVPEAVAALKVAGAAAQAVIDFQNSTTKAADVLAIEKQLVALTADSKVFDAQTQDVKDDAGFLALSGDLSGDLLSARSDIGNTTVQLTAIEALSAAKLADDRKAVIAKDDASIDKITAYEKAFAAAAVTKTVAPDNSKQAVDTLAAYGTNAANATVWDKALADAGVDKAVTTAPQAQAQAIYDLLANKSTAQATVDKIAADFTGVDSFKLVGTLSAQQQAFNKAADALSTADKALSDTTPVTGKGTVEGAAWVADYKIEATNKLKLDASKSLDALESSYKVIADAYSATTQASSAAAIKLGGYQALTVAANTAGTDAKDDVFYFPAKVAQTSDIQLNFGAKDSLYIGEGYTLGKGTLDSTTGHILGGNNNALEVFFIKDGANVKAVVETTAFGSETAAANTGALLPATSTDGVAVITLTGVTDVSQVTFANGVISHVA